MNLQLEDLKKSASIAWDELDKSHAARAKLHDKLIIAEGQRDQWKMKYADAKQESSAWEEYHKIKEKLAQTKSKLGQSEDYISETLKPQLADAKKSATIAWDELDNFRVTDKQLRIERDALRTDKMILEDACANACEAIEKLESERDALQASAVELVKAMCAHIAAMCAVGRKDVSELLTKEGHFVPPSLGEEGFYICNPKENTHES